MSQSISWAFESRQPRLLERARYRDDKFHALPLHSTRCISTRDLCFATERDDSVGTLNVSVFNGYIAGILRSQDFRDACLSSLRKGLQSPRSIAKVTPFGPVLTFKGTNRVLARLSFWKKVLFNPKPLERFAVCDARFCLPRLWDRAVP